MNLACALLLASGSVTAALVVIGVVAFIGGLIFWGVKSSARARQANEAWAGAMGFRYEGSGWPLGDTQGERLELIRVARGYGRPQFRNVSQGKYRGRDVTVFDLDYVQGQDTDGNDMHHTLTVAAFPLPGHGVPEFQIHPQNVFHKLKNKVVNSDISFDAPAEFSRKYFVRGADAEAVRRFLSGSFLDFVAGLDGTHYTVEGGNDWILIHAGAVSAKNRREWLDRVMSVLEAMDLSAAAGA